MNVPRESTGQEPEGNQPAALDELLRRRFSPPTDLPTRAANMVTAVARRPAAPRRWWPWSSLLAAAALVFLWATTWQPAGPPPHQIATDALWADATTAFPPTLVSCSTGPVPPPPTLEACTTAPPLPYIPAADEQLVGPLTCSALPQAHRYWSRNLENTVLLLILPAEDTRGIEWSGQPVATIERRIGALRVVFVSTTGTAAAEQRAARLR
ncbi:MAG: hypothetical protein IPK26_29755 [Planctomycetes bacterium]|nr:hypothetical protein [Planctomycetota bacterium]